MKRKYALPELLAPAGDFSALEAAICAGADAIYVGGHRFGARAYAKNFDSEELRRAVVLCHAHGVKLYVTLNTLIYDKEMPDAVAYAKELSDIGTDAVIAADLGVIKRIRDANIHIPLHASTQMGIHNSYGADLAYSLGCERVVLARECTSEDIKKITEVCSSETEIFIHGAMCVCHSGQCLFSSLVGGRSGNRGECAQPCRLPYNGGKYPLSLADMCLASHIDTIIDSGVASLKIEGRMKSPDYVYGVTSIYRRLLDERRNATEEEIARLGRIFSRGKFTDGYYTDKKFSSMTGVRRQEDKSNSRQVMQENAGAGISYSADKLHTTARAELHLGSPAVMSLTAGVRSQCGDFTVTARVWGDIPSPAINAPLTEDALRDRLSKMGNTPFALSREDIELDFDGNINLSPSAINGLRRLAVAELEAQLSRRIDQIIGQGSDTPPTLTVKSQSFKGKAPKRTALFLDADLPSELLTADRKRLSGIDVAFVPLEAYEGLAAKHPGAVTGVYLPPVITESQWDEARALLLRARELGAEYALAGNISHLSLARSVGISVIGDFRLNIANSDTASVYAYMGVEYAILSPELTLPMARDIGGSVITMGRIPLMLTERCFVKENFGCKACGKASFSDRTGAEFPIMKEWGHRNLILNSMPTYMGDKRREVTDVALGEHFIFSMESSGEVGRMLNSYFEGKPMSSPHRRLGSRRSTEKNKKNK